MSRIPPIPTRSGLLDRLGNISQNWVDWIRNIKFASESALDTEVLQVFRDLNQPVVDEESAILASMPTDRSVDLSDDAPQLPAAPAFDLSAFFADLERLEAPHPERSWSEIAIVSDTAANAGKYPAAAYVPGSLRFETDTDKLFIQIGAAWVQLIAPALLQFLGTTNAFPALKRSGTTLQVRLADDSDYTALEVKDDSYGAGWSGSVQVPTKSSVYAEVEVKANKQTPGGPQVIPLAKLTSGGTDGSFTITADGVVSAFTLPT